MTKSKTFFNWEIFETCSKNLGKLDKLLRIGLGATCIYLGFFENVYLDEGPFSLLLGVIGIINIAFALVSSCPIYQLAGINTSSAHQTSPENLKLRNRLLLSFIFVAVTLVVSFALISFQIAKEFSLKEDLEIWKELATERASYVQINNTAIEIKKLPLNKLEHAVVLDSNFTPLNEPPEFLSKQQFESIKKDLSTRQGNVQAGSEETANALIIWGLAPIPDTSLYLLIFHDANSDSDSMAILAKQYFIAATILLWFSIWGALIFSSIVSKRISKQSDIIIYQALHDGLTGLPNRKCLLNELKSCVENYHKKNSTVLLLIFNINRFKDINDLLGHRSGDELLKEVAHRLKKSLKFNKILARLDSDKFAILVHEKNSSDLNYYIHRISQIFDAPYLINEMEIQCEISLGIATYPGKNNDPMCIVRQAELAMFQSKEWHQDYVIYSPEKDNPNKNKLAIISELRHAIENDELRLYYQPKIDFNLGCTTSLEALIRWEHPTRGLVYPDSFIPEAEQTGLIKPLTLWTIREAIKQLQTWKKDNIILPVAVNFSQRLLSHSYLTDDITQLLNEYSIDSKYFELEITESAIMSEAGGALEMIHNLRNIGIPLSLDDFGTGYTSMSHLKDLPIQTIKIDKSFVLKLAEKQQDAVIVNSIIQFGHNMGHKVVAEGIENIETWNILKNMGCDVGQGFYMARPMPAEDVANWLRNSKWPLASSFNVLKVNQA